MRISLRSPIVVAAAAVTLSTMTQTAAAQTYAFTKVADSGADGSDPSSFGCAAINARGDVAFRAGRVSPDGFNTTPGIYRANPDGTITTIAEDRKRFSFIGFNPSLNDLGQVSFAARIDGGRKPDTEAILRGDGKKLTTIASAADRFNFFGFDTSINDQGEVAFKAELDEAFGFDEGLFSGQGGKAGVTTHYLASTSDFEGNDSRTSINDLGDIAFVESVDFTSGVFAGRTGTFVTIAAPDPDVSVQEPTFNDAGTAAFVRSGFDETTQSFVSEIVTGSGGPLTVVADTRGEFGSFGVPATLDQRRGRRRLLGIARRLHDHGHLRGPGSCGRSGDRDGRHARRVDDHQPHALRGRSQRLR